VGDDLNDLTAFEVAGVKVAVKDAAVELKREADFVVPVKGGNGVIRHLTERILKCKGLWKKAVEEFLRELKEK